MSNVYVLYKRNREFIRELEKAHKRQRRHELFERTIHAAGVALMGWTLIYVGIHIVVYVVNK